ncbi:helix-turn-helix transcriptional regulator [Sphingomonas mali]|uniref:helix-turn-helix transcriptional regulator n=1 Tax=Sphingomonas mali TaxID=40682 RepID=UPI000A022212|nr:AlpA family phage regulatory protein [Sphingomonas mali]
MNGAGPSSDRFIKLDEVKRRVGLGKSMNYRLISEGKFPAPYKSRPSPPVGAIGRSPLGLTT